MTAFKIGIHLSRRRLRFCVCSLASRTSSGTYQRPSIDRYPKRARASLWSGFASRTRNQWTRFSIEQIVTAAPVSEFLIAVRIAL